MPGVKAVKWLTNLIIKRQESSDTQNTLDIRDENNNTMLAIGSRGEIHMSLDQFSRVEWVFTGNTNNAPWQIYNSSSGSHLWLSGPLFFEVPALRVKEGSNKTMGLATLVAGTVHISTDKVAVNSRIFLTAQSTGGTPGALRISSRASGVGFDITSTSATDTSTVAWLMIDPTGTV